MAIIPLTTRPARAIALRREDRFPRLHENGGGQPVGFFALLIATAMVAASVVALLAYDARRPLAMGAINAPAQSLVISVEPMTAGESR